MFPDRGWNFKWIKTFNGESDSSGISDSCSSCGRPHNAYPIAKITNVKDLTLTFWSVSYPIKTSFSVKNILSKRFSTCFFHLNPLTFRPRTFHQWSESQRVASTAHTHGCHT